MKRRFHCKKVEQLKQEVVILSGAAEPNDPAAPPKVMQRDSSTSLGMTV
jgi:hypothetical protein